jgi:hypothetical protein
MSLLSSSIARAAMTALFIGASAQATILNEYSDLSSWNAVVTAPVTQNFSGAGSTYSTSSAGINVGSINYLGFYNESSSVGYDTYLNSSPSAGVDMGTGAYIMGGTNFVPGTGVATPDTGIRVNFSSLAAFNALSFEFSAFRSNGNMVYSTVGVPIQLTLQVFEGGSLTDTRTLTVPTGSPSPGFFGFTTTGSISSIRLLISTPTGTDENRILLDNLAYAQIAEVGGGDPPPSGGEVPEPQAFLLCGLGLLSVAWLRRKR